MSPGGSLDDILSANVFARCHTHFPGRSFFNPDTPRSTCRRDPEIGVLEDLVCLNDPRSH